MTISGTPLYVVVIIDKGYNKNKIKVLGEEIL
jgi:hypothetical protein